MRSLCSSTTSWLSSFRLTRTVPIWLFLPFFYSMFWWYCLSPKPFSNLIWFVWIPLPSPLPVEMIPRLLLDFYVFDPSNGLCLFVRDFVLCLAEGNDILYIEFLLTLYWPELLDPFRSVIRFLFFFAVICRSVKFFSRSCVWGCTSCVSLNEIWGGPSLSIGLLPGDVIVD